MKIKSKRFAEIALPPGTLVYVGDKKQEKASITIIEYQPDRYKRRDNVAVEECRVPDQGRGIIWINVDGIHDLSAIEYIGTNFKLHPLVLEDIVNTSQRPKTEEYQSTLFFVLKMFWVDRQSTLLRSEQISIVLGQNYVLSFQETQGDAFDSIRERIRLGKGRVRDMGADYLAYLLLDTLVDNCFVLMELFGEQVAAMETEIVSAAEDDAIDDLYALRRNLLQLRRSLWPTRELIQALMRSEMPLIEKSTRVFLRDAYDHAVQILDTVETYREILASMVEIYLFRVSQKTNEVMKVLTIIATIFIPLTFIVGVYGMNFKYMPELDWRFGYRMVWAVMIAVTAGMLVFFKRKQWL